MTYKHIDVRRIAGSCGAEIHGVDLSQALDDATFAEIRKAFVDNQVIFFRDQHITEDQHKAFGRRFGTLNIHPRYLPLEGHPEIFPIRKDPDHTENIGGVWHHDLTHLPEPPMGSILYALEVPPYGGDTMFANQYLAYEALSDGMKLMLDGMTAFHDNRIQSNKVAAERNAARASQLRVDNQEDEPECEHPVVITHPESGKKALYVNIIRTQRFAGMTEEESKPLIKFLCDHATRPEFTCRFKWENGSIAFWDNRCVMHFALNDYHGYRRYMNRVTVNGARPVH
jgi:taurine dioxygenase